MANIDIKGSNDYKLYFHTSRGGMFGLMVNQSPLTSPELVM